MLKQLKYDFRKLILQRKYLFILIGVSLFGASYSILLSQKEVTGTDIVTYGLTTFRPIYWFLCCYTICDVVSNDYHYKTLKTVIPYAESRTNYIISKLVSSVSISFLILLVYLLASNMTVFALNEFHSWALGGYSFALICAGAIIGIIFLESLTALCMVMTENEAATIGFSMGILIIIFILESIENFSMYLPTMWVATLPSIVKTRSDIGLIVIGSTLVLSMLLLTVMVKLFKNKDLFA